MRDPRTSAELHGAFFSLNLMRVSIRLTDCELFLLLLCGSPEDRSIKDSKSCEEGKD